MAVGTGLGAGRLALGPADKPAQVALAGLVGAALIADARGAALDLPAAHGMFPRSGAMGDEDDVEKTKDGVGGLAPPLLVALHGLGGDTEDAGHLVLGDLELPAHVPKRLGGRAESLRLSWDHRRSLLMIGAGQFAKQHGKQRPRACQGENTTLWYFAGAFERLAPRAKRRRQRPRQFSRR